jgi:hypothetical protein
MEGGFCPESIFPLPEEREYRERWSPFRQRGRGISKKDICRFSCKNMGCGGMPPFHNVEKIGLF